jgi:hypothetical protein
VKRKAFIGWNGGLGVLLFVVYIAGKGRGGWGGVRERERGTEREAEREREAVRGRCSSDGMVDWASCCLSCTLQVRKLSNDIFVVCRR